jgi:diguanylate cyclase (GGDEF)-like protein/PAS domain S-box-containing protein
MISPLSRISFGLVFLTLSILLTGDVFFGITAERSGPVLQARKKICEALAVQFSALIPKNDTETIRTTLQSVVKRNSDILSAALRSVDGRLLAEAGVHDRYWKGIPADTSTPTHTQVPIFNRDVRWGTVEVRFEELSGGGMAQIWSSPFAKLILFVSILGFFGYLFFMKRTLKHLDPSAVIPSRVKAAMDVLADGVVLVNENTEIVLANAAFSEKSGLPAESILGKNLSKMDWKLPKSEESATDFPWEIAMREAEDCLEVGLCLESPEGGRRSFMVNGSPILGDKGESRGALATFDDITELEQKNEQLSEMVVELKESSDKIGRQNEKLHILATRDPLTNCLNRRSFFEYCNSEFETAKRDGTPLSCIMTDIDHFKSVNDTYGHGVGDEVIKAVTENLRVGLRTIDHIGRYGGEEFCLLLPGVPIEQAAVVADRLRGLIEEKVSSASSKIEHTITSSFGVSSTEMAPADPSKLVDQADQALYASKTSGRNRVTRFDEVAKAEVA